jgi:ElaB/YqjD/DUF883 family membrane-anchored ribosome-binding protein
MEDIWKKFKQETQKHVQKINEFLNEKSSKENSQLHEPEKAMTDLNKEMYQINEQVQQIFLKDEDVSHQSPMEVQKQIEQAVWIEKSNENFHVSRKKIYGRLRDLVKEIMEKENLSRAQAYRKAKKRLLENSK